MQLKKAKTLLHARQNDLNTTTLNTGAKNRKHIQVLQFVHKVEVVLIKNDTRNISHDANT